MHNPVNESRRRDGTLAPPVTAIHKFVYCGPRAALSTLTADAGRRPGGNDEGDAIMKTTRARRRGLLLGILAGGVLLAASGAWACTVGLMEGEVWITGPVDASGDCPGGNAKSDAISSAPTGATVCVQAGELQRSGFGVTTAADDKYDLRYIPDEGGQGDMACHTSPAKLPNLDSADGLYTAKAGVNGLAPRGGWEDQRTVLAMPQGAYIMCAAQVRAYGDPLGTAGTGYFDSQHLSFTVLP